MAQSSGIKLKSGDRIVFFGDSITQADPGYVSFIQEMLDALYPELSVTIINRGIGGNNVRNLLERAQDHVIAENPDWVSISVGINDCANLDQAIDPPEYETLLNELVTVLKQKTSAVLLLCTPSLVGENPDGPENARLGEYVEAMKRVAASHNVTVVPIHDAFISALRRAKGTTDQALFTVDGIHMNKAGNALFGTTWLKTLGAFEDLLPTAK